MNLERSPQYLRGTFRLAALLSALSIGSLAVAEVAELEVSSDQSIDIAHVYSGEGFTATTPNSGAAHRNAVVVFNESTLTLDNGSDLWVKNDFNTAFLRVGYHNVATPAAGAGTLTILSGAKVQVGQASHYANFMVGEGVGNTGVVNQTGGDVTVLGSFNVGVDGGDGTYTISDGTLTIDHADDAGHTSLATIGLNLNLSGPSAGTSSGQLLINGGRVNVLVHEWDPISHPGVYGSTEFILGNRDRGAASYGDGNGTITQTAGVLHIDNRAGFYLSSVGNGEYNLNGGILEIGGNSLRAKYGSGPGTYAFNLGGGTIQVIGSNLVTSVDATLTNSTTSTIDTNGFDATLSGNVTGSGTLVKSGEGTLKLSGTNDLSGEAYVVGGAINQTTGNTTIKYLGVGSGPGAEGDYNLSAGTLNITQALQVGDWSGVGAFNQTGGTVNVSGSFNVGNQGGTGEYNLSVGTLNLSNGLYSLGRNTDTKPAGTGTFNLSDAGVLDVAGGNFVIGNRDNTASSNGSGVFNQTGGIFRISGTTGGDNLFLSGYGDGTYNLLGGTLEIGGNRLQAHYGNGSSTYAFNLGGGTIKVINSALNTSVNATLNAGTTSIIDTNALGATFSGNLTGSGVLAKTGTGQLKLSGTNEIGTLAITDGSATNGTGTTTTGVLVVSSNTGTAASYNLTGGTLNLLVDGGRGEMTIGGGAGYSGVFNQSGGTLNIGEVANYGSFFVGAYDGIGVANQTGGTVNATGGFQLGNRGGDGTYNLSAGLLNVGQYPAANDSNAFILGRSRTGQNVNNSVGYLNISGTGELVLNTNTPLLIGGDYGSDASRSSGYVSQTGGTVTVDSKIDIGSKGHGEYSLTGGVLQIGGTGTLKSTSGDYAFKLGGGTIKVLNSALNTSVNATLNTGTTSTIDTNALGATFSGNLTGQGGLAKIGEGTLLVTGASDYSGATTISAGTYRVDGSLANTTVTVESGAVFSGHGTVYNLNIQSGAQLFLDGTPSALTITGDATLGASSQTILQIQDALTYDQLVLSGTLFADGTLDVQFIAGFTASAGQSFHLIDGTIDGTFSNIELPSLGGGLAWNTNDLYTQGDLSVIAGSMIPEPTTATVIAGGLVLVLAFSRRRRTISLA